MVGWTRSDSSDLPSYTVKLTIPRLWRDTHDLCDLATPSGYVQRMSLPKSSTYVAHRESCETCRSDNWGNHDQASSASAGCEPAMAPARYTRIGRATERPGRKFFTRAPRSDRRGAPRASRLEDLPRGTPCRHFSCDSSRAAVQPVTATVTPLLQASIRPDHWTGTMEPTGVATASADCWMLTCIGCRIIQRPCSTGYLFCSDSCARKSSDSRIVL